MERTQTHTHTHNTHLLFEQGGSSCRYLILVVLSWHRDTINVGWDGRIFDCDFNQQLELGMGTAGTNAGASDKLRSVQVGSSDSSCRSLSRHGQDRLEVQSAVVLSSGACLVQVLGCGGSSSFGLRTLGLSCGQASAANLGVIIFCSQALR